MSDSVLSQAKASLLVVEDDPAMLVALRDILEGAGYDVATAPNGKAALDIMASHRPTLILSDISMPIMDGIELFESVRKLPGAATIPFIFLTARGTHARTSLPPSRWAQMTTSPSRLPARSSWPL